MDFEPGESRPAGLRERLAAVSVLGLRPLAFLRPSPESQKPSRQFGPLSRKPGFFNPKTDLPEEFDPDRIPDSDPDE